jgi:hypothetical protein
LGWGRRLRTCSRLMQSTLLRRCSLQPRNSEVSAAGSCQVRDRGSAAYHRPGSEVCWFIGVGETPEDLQPFDAVNFAEALFPAAQGSETTGPEGLLVVLWSAQPAAVKCVTENRGGAACHRPFDVCQCMHQL